MLFLAALALGAAVLFFVPAPAAIPAALERAVAEEILRQEMPDELAFAESADFDSLPRSLDQLDEPGGWLMAAIERCGSIELDAFEGRWSPPTGEAQWVSAEVSEGRLQAGTILRSDHCPVHVVEQSAERLVAVALWHEDVRDPGDAWLTYLRLTRHGETLEVCVSSDLDRIGSTESCTELTRER